MFYVGLCQKSDLIFGEVDTHAFKQVATKVKQLLSAKFSYSPNSSCLDNLEAHFEYMQSHLVQEEYKIYWEIGVGEVGV